MKLDVNIINTTLLVDNAATHCIYVQAVDDSIIEAEEMFTISVSWMPGDNSTSIPVTIIDNDREFKFITEVITFNAHLLLCILF